MSLITRRATLDELSRTEGQAELIDGRIVRFPATGVRPYQVVGNIYGNLLTFSNQTNTGQPFTHNLVYAISELPSGRASFSPDASYYDGPFPANEMRFVEGPPTFAVEVRSENDYSVAAQAEMAAKRADYFAAGTLVVWDVDPIAETVHCYRKAAPDQVVTWRQGDIADAEPAVPRWRMSLAEMFA